MFTLKELPSSYITGANRVSCPDLDQKYPVKRASRVSLGSTVSTGIPVTHVYEMNNFKGYINSIVLDQPLLQAEEAHDLNDFEEEKPLLPIIICLVASAVGGGWLGLPKAMAAYGVVVGSTLYLISLVNGIFAVWLMSRIMANN